MYKFLKKNIVIKYRYPFYYGYYVDKNYSFPLNARYCKTKEECIKLSKKDIDYMNMKGENK